MEAVTDRACCHRQADLIDITDATDIHSTEFDDPSNPIAADGELDDGINPANYVSFVSFIDSVQLARFGIHNGSCFMLYTHSAPCSSQRDIPGKPVDQTLIDAKWESLALAPVGDSDYPDDYFLFTAVGPLPAKFALAGLQTG